MAPTRRLVNVMASNELIVDMMRTGWKAQLVVNRVGLPEDAVFIGAYNDTMAGAVYFTFSHPSFDEVPNGALIPVQSVSFGKYFYPDVQELLDAHIREDTFPMGQVVGNA